MDITKLFICNLKKWRREKGLSQKALAERCGTGYNYIRQLESANGNPSFLFIGKIADALGIEPYQLFYDDTPESFDKPGQAELINPVKADFLDRISIEFDRAIKKIT